MSRSDKRLFNMREFLIATNHKIKEASSSIISTMFNAIWCQIVDSHVNETISNQAQNYCIIVKSLWWSFTPFTMSSFNLNYHNFLWLSSWLLTFIAQLNSLLFLILQMLQTQSVNKTLRLFIESGGVLEFYWVCCLIWIFVLDFQDFVFKMSTRFWCIQKKTYLTNYQPNFKGLR